MLRIRIDGGRLTLAQLRMIAHISTTYGRDTADITDRQNIQLHWIRIEDVPAIWQLARRRWPLHDRGLRRHSSRHPRLPGGRRRRRLDHRRAPGNRAIVETYIGDPSLSNLPRKFKTAISGSPAQDVAHEVNDLSFVGVRHPGARSGLRRLHRRRPVDQPHVCAEARSLRHPDEIPEVWHGIVRCSATTDTAGFATERGSSSWSPTGAWRSSARCSRPSTCAAR